MKFCTSQPKSDQVLRVYITAQATGIKIEPENTGNKIASLEVEKNKPTLDDAEVICRFMSSKQPKLKLVPDSDSPDFYHVEQWLECISSSSSISLDAVAKQLGQNKFLIGDKLSLADIFVWSTLYKHRESLSGTVQTYFAALAEEKAFKAALKMF